MSEIDDWTSAPAYRLACMRCAFEAERTMMHRCPRCAGALEARLSLMGAVPRDEIDPELSYVEFLPLEPEDLVDLGLSVHTPCRPARRLGPAIGVPGLWIKDETAQPTGTTKDRMAAVVLGVLRSFGITEFVASSTGNSATAFARAVRRDPVMRAHFFCARDARANHGFAPDDRVRLTVVDGDYVRASAEARRFAVEHGLHWEGGFFNWARREGLKLAYLEALDEMDRTPDVIVQSVSSGMGVVAAAKGAREYLRLGRIDRLPRFLMAQQDTCAPMATAWRAGRHELTDDDVVPQPIGLASAILLGDSREYYPYLAAIADESSGSIVSVTQDQLVATRRALWDLERLDVCYAAAAAVAAVQNEAAAGRVAAFETVLVNLTGRSRPAEPDSVRPESAAPDSVAGVGELVR